MEDGRYVTLFLKSVRRSALTGAMAGSLLLAATASAFADTAKSQASGPGASSGDATLTKTTTSTTQGGNSSSSSTPTTSNLTSVQNTTVKSTPNAQSQNHSTTTVIQMPSATGGTNTNSVTTSLTCTPTNTAPTNSQNSTRSGDDGGSSGNNTHEPTAKCTHDTGSTRVYQSAKGLAEAANVNVSNDYKSTTKTGNSTADAQVSPEGKAKISDSGAGATSATTSNTNGTPNGNGDGNGSGSGDKAKSVASSKGSDDSSNGASSGDAKLTKETNSTTTGGNADASSNPSATNHTTVGNTYVKSAPKAFSYNLAGVNITCTPTAIAGDNSNTLSTTLTGSPSNDTSGNTQTSTRSGTGSGNSGHNSLKPDAQSNQQTGSYRVKQSADATASCGTITIINKFDSNTTTGDSTAKADVSPTGEASIKNSGAAATSATTSKTYGEGYGGVGGGDPRAGGGLAIITSGGSTNIGARRSEDLASVKAAESGDEGTRIITSGGSTNITAPIAMVAGVTVPPVTPPGGVRAESVAGLAPTGRPSGFAAETEGQPAFTFLLGLILGGFGIVWIGGRRLFFSD